MEENIKLQKPILETKYLTQENTYRYRPIMRFFYNKYEQAEHWLYKEEVFDGIKNLIDDYTIEDCERDLEFLVANLSLEKLQDTQNISTLHDFKVHNFRYQMTDYAVAIERMTIELEEMEVKVSSLEPRLFERINSKIHSLIDVRNLDNDDIFEIWTDLNTDFKNLNQQYQDFLKQFHEVRTEELLRSDAFLAFKSKIINYINDFISSYIKTSTSIKNNLLAIDNDTVNYLMDSLITHQKKVPNISLNFNYEKLRTVNFGKWQSLRKWFLSELGLSEGDRLLEATQQIIEKIYKYANSLIELHGNMINRKEEYKHICQLFDKCDSLEEAHTLSGTIYGIITSKHYKGVSLIKTDSLIKSYDVEPIAIPINSTNKEYKIKSEVTPIINKSANKEKILKNKIKEEQQKRAKIKTLIAKGEIVLKGQIELDIIERRYILGLMSKYHGGASKETEFGYRYQVKDGIGECEIISPDGIFVMPSKIITIEVGDDNG